MKEKEEGREGAKEHGIYNITQIPIDTLFQQETAENNLMLNFTEIIKENGLKYACDKVLDILTKYNSWIVYQFRKEIDQGIIFKVKGSDNKEYSLQDLINELEEKITKNTSINAIILRHIALKGISIYDYYKARLKVILPTAEHNPKKKLIKILYSTVKDFNPNLFLEQYKIEKINKYYYKNLNFLGYAISKMKDWNRDVHIIVVGSAQVGKSTFCFDLSKIILAYRSQQITSDFLHNIIWDARQGFIAFKTFRNSIIIGDEGLWLLNSREAMQWVNIKWLQFLNFNASKHNIIFTNTQDYTLLDKAIKKKTNVLVLINKTGIDRIFARGLSYPIIENPIINIEKFEKNPNLLDDEDRANLEFVHDKHYIYNTHFWKYGHFPDEQKVWLEYLDIKEKEQLRAIGEAEQSVEAKNLESYQIPNIDVSAMLKNK